MIFSQKKYEYPTSNVYQISWEGDGTSSTTLGNGILNGEIEDWCIKNFGKSGFNDDTQLVRWVSSIHNNQSIVFLREEDMILFKLRWE